MVIHNVIIYMTHPFVMVDNCTKYVKIGQGCGLFFLKLYENLLKDLEVLLRKQIFSYNFDLTFNRA